MCRVLVLSVAGLLVASGCAQDPDSAVSPSVVSTTVATVESTTLATVATAASTSPTPSVTTVVPTDTATTTSVPPPPPAPTTAPPAPTPASTSPPSQAPPATGATPLTPAFLAFDVSEVAACPAPDVSVPLEPRQVTVSWEVIGAESVYVAIDDVDGPFETGLPPAGSITLPNSCPDGNTYFVVAENPEGRTISEATR